MSALPAEPDPDSLDPVGIIADLPEEEREAFLDEYRRRARAAADPEGWLALRRLLRTWRGHIEDMRDPSYWQAAEAAGRPVSGGMSLDDVIRTRHAS